MDEKINDEKNIKKKKLIGQIVLTSIFGLIIIGVSLAIFFARASGGLNNITTKDLVDVTYTEGSTLRLTSNTPIFEDEIEDKATEFNFTVNNPNSTPVYASIDLSSISMSSSLKTYDFKWALYEGDTKLTTGSFIDAGTNLNLYNNSVINGDSSKTYKIRIWLNETGETQSFQGTSFTSQVEVTAYSRELRTLNSKILSETTKTNPSFTQTHTDIGLYVQKDDSEKSNYGFPTYYYRGDVTNNYVSFSGKIWRIVRINEDGSIRLIYESGAQTEPTVISYTSNGTAEYIGSNLENNIRSWYNNNITSDNNITTGNYCSMNWVNHHMAEPIFTCNDGVNINEKYGTLSADETVFAGGLFGEVLMNTSSYLETSDTDWWLMTTNITGTGNQKTSNVWKYIADPGIPDSGYEATGTATFRPVINLKSNVLVKSGDGTQNNPYIISEASL